ncbi:sigma-70 family RNA polymerase sigma factor [Tundrisphaera sp. TA3]|uniref:RNA polymerase sigma factor n=1 Tax=Tundrisphaera sp. TA3 TaxID=3435775 RepID=UPI003EBFE653
MMMGRRCDEVIRGASALFRQGPIGDLSDRQLLGRFASLGGDAAESAFAALVERHGPMVLRTCRSILRDGHDAHDAFQATFLVLARRAGSAWSGDSVAAWLHQVARRTSLCARSASARRRKHEARAAALAPTSVPDPPRDDLGEALHAEIARLPDRFRAAVVLCLLEGYTHDQAARQLDVPVGTLQSRLSRGRERLRSRLTRRGLAPSVAPSALLVPPSWIDGAAQAATRFATGQMKVGMVPATVLSLAQEVCNAMMTSKLKLIGAAVLGLGLGVSGVGALAQQQGTPPGAEDRPESRKPPATRPVPAPDPSAILTPPLEGYERITIQYERVDGSGRVSYVQVVSSELDASGTVRITSDERSGDDRRQNRIQGKSASIQITKDQASDHFDIKIGANDSPWAIPRQGRSTTAPPPGEAQDVEIPGLAKPGDRRPAPAGLLETSPAADRPSPDPTTDADTPRRNADYRRSELDARPILPRRHSSRIPRPEPDMPIVIHPGGSDLAPISPGPEDGNPDSLPSSAVGTAPEGMEWVREKIGGGKTLDRLIPIRSPRPTRTDADPAPDPLFEADPAPFAPANDRTSEIPSNPQDENHRARRAQDRRMDEMERKLDLILRRLDGRKNDSY